MQKTGKQKNNKKVCIFTQKIFVCIHQGKLSAFCKFSIKRYEPKYILRYKAKYKQSYIRDWLTERVNILNIDMFCITKSEFYGLYLNNIRKTKLKKLVGEWICDWLNSKLKDKYIHRGASSLKRAWFYCKEVFSSIWWRIMS
mgnify:CR=1 FL=1